MSQEIGRIARFLAGEAETDGRVAMSGETYRSLFDKAEQVAAECDRLRAALDGLLEATRPYFETPFPPEHLTGEWAYRFELFGEAWAAAEEALAG